MQQLKSILIGLSGTVLSTVEAELRDYGATVDASFQDADAAVSHYRIPASEKRLFVYELKGPEELPRLARLTNQFPGQPILIISLKNDSSTLLNAIRAGASQWVTIPLSPGEFRDALDQTSRQFGLRTDAGRVICVAGASEGCGASMIAVNFAAEASRHGVESTLLIEVGKHLGRLAVTLGISPKYTVNDLLEDMNSVDLEGLRQAITPVQDGLWLLPGAYKSISIATQNFSSIFRLLTLARRIAGYVVLDLSSTFDATFFEVLKAADDIILVAEQTVPSIHSLSLLHDALVSQGIHGQTYDVINRYSEEMPGATLAEIQDLIPGAQLFPIRSDGRATLEAINQGKPLRDAAPNSLLLEDLNRLLETISHKPVGPSVATKHQNWFQRELKKLASRLQST